MRMITRPVCLRQGKRSAWRARTEGLSGHTGKIGMEICKRRRATRVSRADAGIFAYAFCEKTFLALFSNRGCVQLGVSRWLGHSSSSAVAWIYQSLYSTKVKKHVKPRSYSSSTQYFDILILAKYPVRISARSPF